MAGPGFTPRAMSSLPLMARSPTVKAGGSSSTSSSAAASPAGGVVARVVEPGHAFPAAIAIGTKLATLPREALRAARRLLHDPEETRLERVDREARVFAERLRSTEFQTRAAKALGRD